MNRIRCAVLTIVLSVVATATNAVRTFEDEFDQTYTLAPDATIRLKNTDGSIRFYGADVSEVHVHAVKKAYTAERLNGISIEATATGNALSIETHFPAKKSQWTFSDRSGTVDYIIVVPVTVNISECDLVNGEILIEGLQGGSAKAHLVNGWLAGHNCFADLDLSIVNGKLDLAYDWWQSEKNFSANASSVNGSIRALLPPDSSVSIAAQSEKGRVGNAFTDDAEPNDEISSVDFAVGSGEGAEMTLRAANGNVRIEKSY